MTFDTSIQSFAQAWRFAVSRVEPASLDQLLHPTIDPKAERRVLATGLPASPGAAVGEVVFDADTAAERGERGEAVGEFGFDINAFEFGAFLRQIPNHDFQ